MEEINVCEMRKDRDAALRIAKQSKVFCVLTGLCIAPFALLASNAWHAAEMIPFGCWAFCATHWAVKFIGHWVLHEQAVSTLNRLNQELHDQNSR